MSDSKRTCLYGHRVNGLYNECPRCGTSVFVSDSDRVHARKYLMEDAGKHSEMLSRNIKSSVHPDDMAYILAGMPAHTRKLFIYHTIEAFIRQTIRPETYPQRP